MKTAIILTLLALCHLAAAHDGGESGGGGDATEARVNEIRSDIYNWIQNGGSSELLLPEQVTHDEYKNTMSDILMPKVAIITFVTGDSSTDEELQVKVAGKPKTCRAFYSRKDRRPNIICNIERFRSITDSEQYRLIHHEYAGLVGIEKNEGSASDYEVSNQITDFLESKTVLRLAVKRSNERMTVDENLEAMNFMYRFPELFIEANTKAREITQTVERRCYDKIKFVGMNTKPLEFPAAPYEPGKQQQQSQTCGRIEEYRFDKICTGGRNETVYKVSFNFTITKAGHCANDLSVWKKNVEVKLEEKAE